MSHSDVGEYSFYVSIPGHALGKILKFLSIHNSISTHKNRDYVNRTHYVSCVHTSSGCMPWFKCVFQDKDLGPDYEFCSVGQAATTTPGSHTATLGHPPDYEFPHGLAGGA